MADNIGDNLSGEHVGSSQSSTDETHSESSSSRVSRPESNRSDQYIMEEDAESTPADQGGLFARENDDDLRTWAATDPWDHESYFVKNLDDVSLWWTRMRMATTTKRTGRYGFLEGVVGSSHGMISGRSQCMISCYREIGLRLPF
ncbi:unnamed protein product [Vicia faba]|uniref:Uncharacterized protein n=1 Tax=Vicia faba TaxID=3906 RepID=A0AAV0ZQW6_VICFA|nr:unnamed protein product [Vicia faba]